MNPIVTARTRRGALWGLYATVAMTALMLIGMLTGLAPMPEPVPLALAALVLVGAPKPILMGAGLLMHFLYGAAAGALLVRQVPRVDLRRGLLFGTGLWLVMQVAFLPLLGWGLFGSAVTLKIAVATLLLHLVYGAVLGGVDRQTVTTGATAEPGQDA